MEIKRPDVSATVKLTGISKQKQNTIQIILFELLEHDFIVIPLFNIKINCLRLAASLYFKRHAGGCFQALI